MKKFQKKSKIVIFVFLFALLFSVSALAVGNYKSFAYAFGWATSDSSSAESNSGSVSVHSDRINPSTSTIASISDSQTDSTEVQTNSSANSINPVPITEQLSIKSKSSEDTNARTSSDDPNNETSHKKGDPGSNVSPTPATPNSSSISSNPIASTPSAPTSSTPSSPSSESGSKGHSGGSSVPIASVTLNAFDITLKKGDTDTLSATVSPTNTTVSKTVTWSSSDSSVATVESNGKVTAKAAGAATITAKASGKTATCHVTVVVPATKISLDMTDLSLEKGDSRTLTAAVEPTDSTDKVTWATSNNSIVSVDGFGKITATGIGTATITASAEDGTLKASCAVTVGVLISQLQISDTALSLIKGDSHSLTATIIPPDTTEDKTVIWSSSDSTVATVDSAGKVTAVEGGTAIITALNGSHSAQCTVTVTVPATGLTLSQQSATMAKGSRITLTAEITPSDASDKAVSWSSSDSSVVSVDSSGNVTANNVGTAIITATTDEGLTASCQITVANPVSGLTLDKTALNLVKGTTDVLTPLITPSDATDKAVEWSSSDSSVVSVDSVGNVTAVKGGTATITAKTHDGGFEASCMVSVTVPVTGVALNKTSLSLIKGDSGTLSAIIAPTDATDKILNWTSSNSNICTVAQGQVTATGVGTAVISAATHDGGYTALCTVTVTPDQYTVMVNSTNGTVTGAGTYRVGSTVTLTETPSTGYHFVDWTVDGTEAGTATTYTISSLESDVTVTANFAINVYTISAVSGGNGSVSGGGTYNYGTTVTLTATPAMDFGFSVWNCSDGTSNTSSGFSFVVTKDVTWTASFVRTMLTPTITPYGYGNPPSFNSLYYDASGNLHTSTSASEQSGGVTLTYTLPFSVTFTTGTRVSDYLEWQASGNGWDPNSPKISCYLTGDGAGTSGHFQDYIQQEQYTIDSLFSNSSNLSYLLNDTTFTTNVIQINFLMGWSNTGKYPSGTSNITIYNNSLYLNYEGHHIALGLQ